MLTGCTLSPSPETPDETIAWPTSQTPPAIQVSTSGDVVSRYAMVDGQQIYADTTFVMSRPDMTDNISRQTTLTSSDGNIIIIDQNCIQSTDPTNPYIKCDGTYWSQYFAGDILNPQLDVYRTAFEAKLQY